MRLCAAGTRGEEPSASAVSYDRSRARTYQPSDLGLIRITSGQLSPDGLRVLLRGTDEARTLGGMFYADRASVDARFSAGRYLDTVPVPSEGSAYMTEDCARVYMPALGSLFYAAQR